MAKGKNPDDRPAEAPDPAGPTPEERLAALESALADRDRTIARQAGELALAAENADLLVGSRDKVQRLKGRWVAAKLESAAAKKAYEASLEGHLDLAQGLLSGQQRLPFPPPGDPVPSSPSRDNAPPVATATATATATANAARPIASVEGEAAGDDSWRRVPLGTLGIADELPHSIVAILDEAGIATIGDLSDFGRGGNTLLDVPGIGESKAAKVEAAIDAFWCKWSEWRAKEVAGGPASSGPPTDDDPAADDQDGEEAA